MPWAHTLGIAHLVSSSHMHGVDQMTLTRGCTLPPGRLTVARRPPHARQARAPARPQGTALPVQSFQQDGVALVGARLPIPCCILLVLAGDPRWEQMALLGRSRGVAATVPHCPSYLQAVAFASMHVVVTF